MKSLSLRKLRINLKKYGLSTSGNLIVLKKRWIEYLKESIKFSDRVSIPSIKEKYVDELCANLLMYFKEE